jgi:hypothetical protein
MREKVKNVQIPFKLIGCYEYKVILRVVLGLCMESLQNVNSFQLSQIRKNHVRLKKNHSFQTSFNSSNLQSTDQRPVQKSSLVCLTLTKKNHEQPDDRVKKIIDQVAKKDEKYEKLGKSQCPRNEFHFYCPKENV